MADIFVRLYFQDHHGKLEDAEADYDLSLFGGVLPAAGDLILDPGVMSGLDRTEARNRRIWTVVRRVFNPRDLESYVALVVEERTPSENEQSLIPPS
jgi:hypothetical protein